MRYTNVTGLLLVVLIFNSVESLDICKLTKLHKNKTESYRYKDEKLSDCECSTDNCIRKCCAFGYQMSKGFCSRDNASEFSIEVYNEKVFKYEAQSRNEFSLGLMQNCDFYPLVPSDNSDDTFFIQEDGRLWLPFLDVFWNGNEYCVDYLRNVDGQVAFVCYKMKEPEVESIRFNFSGMIISMPFLLVTFIVYALLPERNLHMKALMSYVISLFFGYIFLVTIQLHPNNFGDVPCSLLAYLCVFAFMLSFYWMNVICVDIWFGFSSLRGFSGQRNSERKRFYFYCAYAWGMSILHILIVLAIQKLSDRAAWYNPGINDGQCFIQSNRLFDFYSSSSSELYQERQLYYSDYDIYSDAGCKYLQAAKQTGYPELMYFYGPMGVLITINLILFTLTAARIRRVKQDTKMLKKSDSKRHNYESDKQKFNLYLKLLLAMGINWSMEIISWAVQWSLQNSSPYVWYLTDFCNAAYGAVIFFIFVFKKSVWKMLKKRYYAFMGKPHLAHSMGTTQTRSTSYSATTSVHEMQPTSNGTTALTSDVA